MAILFLASGKEDADTIMEPYHRAVHTVLFAITVSVFLQACIYIPVTKEVYDEDCKIVSKHMELTPVQIASISHCNQNECVAILTAATATAAASAVISGSIVVVGNVVYWFEKQGQCIRKS
ncbi:MAG: hypothetical protein OEV35_03635 [Gallionellaceae bacterium]|nr:hypothetical protein [Gallionellaceae bacterium]